MTEYNLTISHPFLRRRRFFEEDFRLPKVGAAANDGYIQSSVELTLAPHIAQIFMSPVARSSESMTARQKIWDMVVQFGRLIRAMDIRLRNMPMNGGLAGCHFPEAHPIGAKNPGCNTHYKPNTSSNAFIEVRPVAGSNISRVYRFVVSVTKPLLHKYKGIIPVTNDGFYGDIGPNGNAKGEIRRRNSLGPMGAEGTDGADEYFDVPLRGAIPRNWARRFGNLVYALRYPFNVKLKFTEGFLGVWGITDPKIFRKVGVPFGTFPTEIGDLLWVLSKIDPLKATHVNLNKPYGRTGKKPHIDWLGFAQGSATILMKDGMINVPGLIRIKFDGAGYLEKHPEIVGDINRIDALSTPKGIEFTIERPAIGEIELNVGRTIIKTKGLSIGRLKIVLPPLSDLTSGRKKISEAAFFIDGLKADALSVTDRDGSFSFDARSIKIGKLTGSADGAINLKQISAEKWNVLRTAQRLSIGGNHSSIESIGIRRGNGGDSIAFGPFSNRSLAIDSPAIAIKTRLVSGSGLRMTASAGRMDIALDKVSVDIHEGRIGATNFGQMSVGAGQVGRCSLREGRVRISLDKGVPRADISGIADVTVNKTLGSRLDFNVPGLAVSGELANINISGPAHFVLTPMLWSIRRTHDSPSTKLSLKAQVRSARIVHDPSIKDESIRNTPNGDVIMTDVSILRATLSIDDVSRLEFLTKRHPAANGSRFSHFVAKNVSLFDIFGKGLVWAKLPIWQYVSAKFAKLEGNIKIAEIDIEANGGGRRSSFKDVAFDLWDSDGQRHRCAATIPLLKFSPQDFFIGDPNKQPLKLDCRLNAQLRGGYFLFRGKERPLKERRVYR